MEDIEVKLNEDTVRITTTYDRSKSSLLGTKTFLEQEIQALQRRLAGIKRQLRLLR